jgi:hypothetical protein
MVPSVKHITYGFKELSSTISTAALLNFRKIILCFYFP